MLPEIIVQVLDFLQKDSKSIKNCLSINRQWYQLIIFNKNKYLKTQEMFIFLLSSDYEFRNQINKSIEQLIIDCNFSSILNGYLNDHLNKSKKSYYSDIDRIINLLVNMVPNPTWNQCSISKLAESRVYDSICQWFLKYIHLETKLLEKNHDNTKILTDKIMKITDIAFNKPITIYTDYYYYLEVMEEQSLTVLVNQIVYLLIVNNLQS